jgi:hypothetical protein
LSTQFLEAPTGRAGEGFVVVADGARTRLAGVVREHTYRS